MISPSYVQMMASYNVWQNKSLYGAADRMTDAARRKVRGAFFGSIHQTLNHILWADHLWLNRLGDFDPPARDGVPQSVAMHDDWPQLNAARRATDQTIIDWAASMRQSDLDGNFTWWSGGVDGDMSKPRGLLVTHMFNHQTHHRGQVHAMLTAAGEKPDDTDIPFMPE